jgi:acyl-CoA dehydrogenase
VTPALVRDPLDADPGAAPFEPRHVAVRAEVRSWLGEHVRPFVDEWEATRDFPRELYAQAGAAGLLGWKYAAEWGGCGPDPLSDVVVSEELARCGSGGVAAGLGATKDLAPYYVARFGTDDQRERLLRPAVAGTAVAGLAVTEPGAGSDVAAITTRAVCQDDGSWLLNGAKTFCTNGSWADWVLVAARTSDETGPHAVSLLIVPAGTPGFTSSRIATLGWRTSHTGALGFDDVRLPADALLGGVGEGFVMIMKSFQWERLAIAVASVSASAYHLAVVRERLPAAGSRAASAYAELVERLMAVRALTYSALTDHLAGTEPLREVSAAKWLACDLDVDTALLRLEVTGDGPDAERADRALRDARLGPIGGGAREVMADLVARTLPWGR